MNINCSRESLVNAIGIVSKAVSSRTPLPILQCIRIQAEESTYKLTANDLELGIETAPIEAEVKETGSIALDARLFSEIIRKVNGEMVSLSTDEKNQAKIISGSSEFKIMGQPGEDFPSLPSVEKSKAYTLLQNDLRNMIRQTLFSISQDESKPVLTGELMEIHKNEIQMVTVDGYRISMRKANVLGEYEDCKVILPGKTVNEISKILSAEPDASVSMFITDKHALFDLESCVVVSRLIEGEYIKYAQSFTEDYTTKIYVNRLELLASLERASLITDENKKMPVKLDMSAKGLVITSNGNTGMAYEETGIELEGNDLQIAFNPRYLMEALKAIEEEKVSIQFTTYLSPCIIRPLEGCDYQYLILPLRL